MVKRLRFHNDTPIPKAKITKVGFVSMLPDGNPLIHEWEFTRFAKGYTVDDLREISKDFYGDYLRHYHMLSDYALWGTVA